MEIRRAAVIGLGLIGGSAARELAGRGVEVRGYDPDPEMLRQALDSGVLRGALAASYAGVEGADLVLIATPVSEVVGVLERIAPLVGAGCVVTDAGSTKRSIVEAADRLGVADRFVGSHPLAGDHRAGWGAGREGLFSGATVYLTPGAGTAAATVERVRSFWEGLGAVPRLAGAEEHDRLLAWTSHLPQMASTALALALADAGVGLGELGPGGRDATRLAGSSPEMWSAIALDNAAPLGAALEGLIARLEGVRRAIAERDAPAVRAALAAAREWAIPPAG